MLMISCGTCYLSHGMISCGTCSLYHVVYVYYLLWANMFNLSHRKYVLSLDSTYLEHINYFTLKL